MRLPMTILFVRDFVQLASRSTDLRLHMAHGTIQKVISISIFFLCPLFDTISLSRKRERLGMAYIRCWWLSNSGQQRSILNYCQATHFYFSVLLGYHTLITSMLLYSVRLFWLPSASIFILGRFSIAYFCIRPATWRRSKSQQAGRLDYLMDLYLLIPIISKNSINPLSQQMRSIAAQTKTWNTNY